MTGGAIDFRDLTCEVDSASRGCPARFLEGVRVARRRSAFRFGRYAPQRSERIPAYALFVDPPLGRVGLTHAQVRERVRATGRPALSAKMMMTRVGRAREMGETAGFMKIAVDAESKEILGAAILGVHGDEVVQAVLELMTAKQPCTVINRGVHIHPTVTELLPTLLEGLSPLN